MSASRYFGNSLVPQPIRKINPAPSDILHEFKMGERLDNLSYKYYKDPLLSWVIMSANPIYDNEFEIPFGVILRIPFPLQRVFDNWLQSDEM